MQSWNICYRWPIPALAACFLAVALWGGERDRHGASAGAEEEAAAAPAPGEADAEGKPGWLKIGVEIRGRAEGSTGREFSPGLNDGYYLNRVRVNTTLAPTGWLRFQFEGQDSRALAYADKAGLDSVANPFDVRQAYTELGGGENRKWGMRVGRQALAFGDERLVGADNDWCNLGITHDALRLSYRSERARLDWFASAVVENAHDSVDRFVGGQRLSGMYTSFGKEEGLQVEPYLLWKSARGVLDEEGLEGGFDVYTQGVRLTGPLPRRLDFNVEMAFQRGRAGAHSIGAWAGSWGIGYQLWEDERAPHVGVSYNFASGDGNPEDGRRGTFDDLFPAGYNGCGIVDPFAWRNISYVATGLEWQLSRRWHLGVENHSYWLANRRDGLYVDDGIYIVRNPGATTSRVGDQLNVMAGFEMNSKLKLYFGYAHLFAGPYLSQSGHGTGVSSPYVVWNYAF